MFLLSILNFVASGIFVTTTITITNTYSCSTVANNLLDEMFYSAVNCTAQPYSVEKVIVVITYLFLQTAMSATVSGQTKRIMFMMTTIE